MSSSKGIFQQFEGSSFISCFYIQLASITLDLFVIVLIPIRSLQINRNEKNDPLSQPRTPPISKGFEKLFTPVNHSSIFFLLTLCDFFKTCIVKWLILKYNNVGS